MRCEEWDDANSELFKESHDEAVHKNSYKSRLYELISASLTAGTQILRSAQYDRRGGERARNAGYNCGAAATTTLAAAGCVKL